MPVLFWQSVFVGGPGPKTRIFLIIIFDWPWYPRPPQTTWPTTPLRRLSIGPRSISLLLLYDPIRNCAASWRCRCPASSHQSSTFMPRVRRLSFKALDTRLQPLCPPPLCVGNLRIDNNLQFSAKAMMLLSVTGSQCTKSTIDSKLQFLAKAMTPLSVTE